MIYTFGKPICLFFLNDETCDLGMREYIPLFYHNFLRAILNPVKHCSMAGFCDYPTYLPDRNSDFIQRILKDKPPRKIIAPINTEQPLKYIVITDMHPDPLYHLVNIYIYIYIGI